MTGWLEILTVAFVAQLVVLPGEKVQFIIAGLSTRYNPWVVVSAAGTAFAGWTALEILFGEALQRALPPVVLDAFTAALFFVFAILLYRSAPASGEAKRVDPAATDGGVTALGNDFQPRVFGREVPDALGGFVPIFAMMAAGEFGDKTQLVTIGLAAQYGAHPAIWAGEMLAIIPVSLANAFFFHKFSHRLDLRKAHFFSAGLFAFFAADTVLSIVTGFSVWETIVEVASTAVLTLF
ncbi:TMEM165/GDT1 family protein [Haloplanus aerogenes]|uniref:Putative Ca2+/H+ antiporter (TMEM165/GDT1 family) n=1 Tax=Haloplanus aerogenes TaxID=660522 RepID=A0A3M0CX24_9EURY|nr:TMEM165/GDT1 family protein [Haloplanus aerogenes]AZH25072.1 TMEM165/GDT1 family protein [Haloplanus aerogenes]RMB13708.1 putative Ca2+/H+ antiporter (TMEM165/GDT1 family) [Haloplanus aerogenes]